MEYFVANREIYSWIDSEFFYCSINRAKCELFIYNNEHFYTAKRELEYMRKC